jgi:hypothetical protein
MRAERPAVLSVLNMVVSFADVSSLFAEAMRRQCASQAEPAANQLFIRGSSCSCCGIKGFSPLAESLHPQTGAT